MNCTTVKVCVEFSSWGLLICLYVANKLLNAFLMLSHLFQYKLFRVLSVFVLFFL